MFLNETQSPFLILVILLNFVGIDDWGDLDVEDLFGLVWRIYDIDDVLYDFDDGKIGLGSPGADGDFFDDVLAIKENSFGNVFEKGVVGNEEFGILPFYFKWSIILNVSPIYICYLSIHQYGI